MKSTKKCLIENNAIVEALGQGKQSILIRNYKNTLDGFLLYPNADYLQDENYMDSFENEHQSFVKENSNPKVDGPDHELKYYAVLEEEFEKPADGIDDLSKYHIWANQHVQDYINSEKTYVWLLRVYKLKEPVMVNRTNGMVYADADEPVSLDDLDAVLSDAEFNKIKNDLK
ncbi:DUF1802 family protein [Methanobacterium alcaliphilum]|uniref:DUF1802 family protein n=1 Tax=Methanobacterium alcaliphilum TaxID=392018 RepID=UPI00200A9002|nr:DUF1802 family protein [Methanobacterium alcaliphilum]MCK9151366.1 DUF1802 family protein [Methanobacterium alcaliphilum]